jgi:hypothetical protein
MEYMVITDQDVAAQRTERLRQAELAHSNASDEVRLAKRIGAGEDVVGQLEHEVIAWQIQAETLREWLTDDQ